MKPIEAIGWLKDYSREWYTSTKEIDLTEYDYIELLSCSYYDLFYCWHKSTGKQNGRLYYGRWNSGYINFNQNTEIIS
jgi:hypothetical protein